MLSFRYSEASNSEDIAMETVCQSGSLRGSSVACQTRLHGKAGGAIRGQKSGDTAGKSLFCGFHSKEGRSQDSVTMSEGSGLYGVTEGRGSVSNARNLIKQGLEMINVQGEENTSYLYSNVAH